MKIEQPPRISRVRGMIQTGGGRIDPDQKVTVAFNSGQIRPRMYKITSSADLKPGECAFIAAIPGLTPDIPPTVVIYDFGVDSQ